MNVSYKWLKEYVDFDLTPQQVCDALTSTGLEVDALEEVQTVKGGLKGLFGGSQGQVLLTIGGAALTVGSLVVVLMKKGK